jgi:hypothetical protein
MALTIKRPETRVLFCLDGNLKAEHEAAEAEFNAARSRSLADARLNDPVKDLAKKISDIEDAMKASTVEFVIRGMKRGDWNDLVAAHAPREGNALDKSYGFNVEALMRLCRSPLPGSRIRPASHCRSSPLRSGMHSRTT